MTEGEASAQDLAAHFRRPTSGEEADVIRPAGAYFPISAYVRWRTPGPGREALNALLQGVTLLELDHLADAVVDGEPYHLAPLQEFGERDGWTVTTTGSTCLLQRDGEESPTEVGRGDVLLAVELVIRAALEPFDGEPEPPSWVRRSRDAHPRLVRSLDGVELFEPDG